MQIMCRRQKTKRELYTEHQYKVTTDSRTLNTGAHLDFSGQTIAVCSIFIFVVYCPLYRYYYRHT